MTAREHLAPLAARLRAALADEKQRVNLLVCIGLAGLLLLAVSSWLPADSSTQSAAPAAMTDSTADYAAELETRLTALISRVEGAGKTAVMVTLESGSDPETLMAQQRLGEVIKYGVIVVSALPAMVAYPFVQKNFVKGVMIGSLKG